MRERDTMYFPLYVDLTEKNILFAGGGSVAARRVKKLLGFAEHITVISPEFADVFGEIDSCKEVCLIQRRFDFCDLEGRDLVFAATDDPELNRKICKACRERGIPVNVCSDQTLCDFQFPSVVLDGDIVIGVNASGKNHRRVKQVREELERYFNSASDLHPSPSRAFSQPGKRSSSEYPGE